jgi:hypothetical protein
VCYPFDTCPGYITALQPPSTLDTVPTCAGSKIDVPFLSTSIYNSNNVYYAELLNSSFIVIDTLGMLKSSLSYSYPAGDISGTIPLSVPAGCNYYVQVVSTTPNRAPSVWGPFCIQHCDIFTNNEVSVQTCLGTCAKQPLGFNTTIAFNIHKYDSLARYNGCADSNKFEVQLIQFTTYPASFSVLNTGLLA